MIETKSDTNKSISVQTEDKSKPFAHGLNFYMLFWITLFGCIIGYCIEMLWCYIYLGRFESRQGLLYGPLNPVYGGGALLLTVSLYKIRNANSICIFLASAALGGTFEFLCSWIQQIVFGTVSWEYSNSLFNLQGRTNLFYTICWGFLGMVFIKLTLPFFISTIQKIPNRAGYWITWILVFFLLFDIIITSAAAYRQNERRKDIPPRNAIETFLDTHYDDTFMKKVYPNSIVR